MPIAKEQQVHSEVPYAVSVLAFVIKCTTNIYYFEVIKESKLYSLFRLNVSNLLKLSFIKQTLILQKVI